MNFARPSWVHLSICKIFRFRSPERLDGKPYNSLCDIWSFGILLFELASGEYPYACKMTYLDLMQNIKSDQSPSLPSKLDFSVDFQNFIQYCLIKDINKRPSAIELMVIKKI